MNKTKVRNIIVGSAIFAAVAGTVAGQLTAGCGKTEESLVYFSPEAKIECFSQKEYSDMKKKLYGEYSANQNYDFDINSLGDIQAVVNNEAAKGKLSIEGRITKDVLKQNIIDLLKN